jgi:hypothetical protein
MSRPENRPAGLLAAALVCLALASADLQAGVIPVLNPGFEDLTGPPNSTHFDASGRLRDGHFTRDTVKGDPNEFVTATPIPLWVTLPGSDSGTVNPTAAVFPTVPEGQNAAYIGGGFGGGTISQTLAATLTIGSYTLQVDVGNPGGLSFAGYDIQLLAGNTILAEDNNTLRPATTTFLTSTLTYTATAADPNLGRNLTIRLAAITPGFATQTDFDNVRLDGPQAVPEPGSLALLGTAGATLAGFAGWCRRKPTAAA